MFTYSRVSQGKRDGSPVGNVYFGRFTTLEKTAYLDGRLNISRDPICEEDKQEKSHNMFRRFGGTCESCGKTF